MTSTRRPDADTPAGPTGAEEWAADGSTTAFVVRGLVLVAIGGFLGGLAGLGVAGIGVVATWRRRAGLVAAGSAALLLAAALATVFEVVPQPGALRSNFADVRPIASNLGLAAGILALVAVVTLAWRERAPQPAPTATVAATGPTGLRDRLGDPATRARVRAAAPYAVVAGAALVVRTAVAPDALQGRAPELVDNLRIGAGYVLGGPGSYRATGALLPVPALLGAFAPGGATFSLLVAGVAAVVLAMALTRRLAGPDAAVLAGVAVLVVEVATSQRLASTAAAAFLLLAALLGLDQRAPSGRAAFAGVAAGLAVLCEPWAVIGVALLAAWILVGPRGRRTGSIAAALLAVAAALVTCLPWIGFLHRQLDTWALATEAPLTLGTAAALLPLACVAAATTLAPRLPRR